MDEEFSKALNLYTKGGQSAVENAVRSGELKCDKWTYCEACESDEPVLDDLCLVCFSEVCDD